MMLLVNNSLYYYLQYRNLFGKDTFLTVYCHFDFHTCQALLSNHVKQKDAKVYCFNGRSKSWKKSLFFWYDLKQLEILRSFLFLAIFGWVKLKFLPKKPATSHSRLPQTTTQSSPPLCLVGRSSEFGWLPWFFHASQRPHGDQGRTGTTGTSTQAGRPVEGRWASA